MRWLRIGVILTLLLLPIALLVGVGLWLLYDTGNLFYLWWGLPICWGLAYLLSRWWRRDYETVPELALKSAGHWTPKDEGAAKIVQRRQQAVKDINPERLADPRFYLDTALELSEEVARHYHPKAKDPVSSLTVPEIVAAAHLALEDLEVWLEDYVPASHLLTVNQWRLLSKAPGWFKTMGDVSWTASILFKLANITRYAASRFTLTPALNQMHAHLLASCYVFFVRQVGFYLIEMNSGRLARGAASYRAAMAQLNPAQTKTAARREPASDSSEPEQQPLEVTLAFVGQVNAGKSSLVNALLGERKAVSDVLPETKRVDRYRLTLPETGDQLVLLDTPGYGDTGATKEQLRETQQAVRQADLVLLVLNAANPARAADLTIVDDLRDWFEGAQHLKPPPLLAVLTHIDRLTPVLEWQPPYDWHVPTGAKEESISEAVEYNRHQLAERSSGVIPVCADVEHDRTYGVQEWLLPAVAGLLSEARACSVVRTLHAESNWNKARKVVTQLTNAAKELVNPEHLWH